MKKLIKTLLTLALAAGMLMSLGVTAYADSAELPTVSVGYGYGCPDAAAVDMHGAAAETLTLDGIAIELRCEDGTAYIRVTDLAAVKLLRESTAKITELGIDLSKLYIKDGLILIKEDGMTADEVAELEAKISELTRTATIKLTVGDKFALGSDGVAAVCIEIGGFNAPPAQQADEEEEAPAEEPTPKRQLKVEAGSFQLRTSNPPNLINKPETRPDITTIYVTYGSTNESNVHNIAHDTFYNNSITTENKNDFVPVFSKNSESRIYLIKSTDDNKNYYYSKDGGNTYNLLEDCFETEDDKSKEIITSNYGSNYGLDVERDTINKIFTDTTISISTSESKDDEIASIKYKNATPETWEKKGDSVKEKKAAAPDEYTYSYYNGNNYEYIPNNPITVDSEDGYNYTVNVKNEMIIIENTPLPDAYVSYHTPQTGENSISVTSLDGNSNGGEGAPNPVVTGTDGGGTPELQTQIETTTETE